MIRPLACLLALALAFPAGAQIYSWRDKNGKIHYSDVPPASGEVSTMRGSGRAPAAPAAPAADATAEDGAAGKAADKPKTLAERELEFRQRRAQAAEAEAKQRQEQEAAKEREANCDRARTQLAALSSGQRMARFKADGEREVLDDAARAQEIEQMRRHIATSCD